MRIIAIFLLLVGGMSHAQERKVVTCMMESDLFPLWRGPGQERHEYPGVNVELYQHIAARLSFKIEWIRAPFKRCLVLLKSGKVDLLNAASYRDARREYGLYPEKDGRVDPSRRLKFDSYMAYVPVDSKVDWNGQQFRHIDSKRVYIEIGASIQSRLQDMGLNVAPIASLQSAFSMLEKNRAQLVVTNIANGYKYGSPLIKELSLPVETKPYYLMVSRQFQALNPRFVELVWRASADLQARKNQEILNRYKAFNAWPE